MTVRSGDVIRDRVSGEAVAYRGVNVFAGAQKVPGGMFVAAVGGGWVRAAVAPVEVEAWLASANKAYDAARLLYDIAARSGPQLPRRQRLANVDDAALGRLLLHGSTDDAAAAVYELVGRVEGRQMRWTQIDAVRALLDGQVVNMAAGEGKSIVYHAFAGRKAVQGDVDALQVLTTRANLAKREFDILEKLFKPNGFDIVQMNPDGTLPPLVAGRPTVYVGTQEDVAFSNLRGKPVPGRHVVIDEIDEALVYANAVYIISDGVSGPASTRSPRRCEAHGILSPSHLGR